MAQHRRTLAALLAHFFFLLSCLPFFAVLLSALRETPLTLFCIPRTGHDELSVKPDTPFHCTACEGTLTFPVEDLVGATAANDCLAAAPLLAALTAG